MRRIQAGKSGNVAVCEDHITGAIRIIHPAFVGKHGTELTGRIENVGELLGNPPTVFAPASIIVVAAAHPVQRGSIPDVAPLIEQRAVIFPITGDITVAMEFPRSGVSVRRAVTGTWST